MQGKNRNLKAKVKNLFNQSKKLGNPAISSRKKQPIRYQGMNSGYPWSADREVKTTHTNIDNGIWHASSDSYRWVNDPPGYPYDKKKWKYIKGSQSKLQFGSDWYTNSMSWTQWGQVPIVEGVDSSTNLPSTTIEGDLSVVATSSSGMTIAEAIEAADNVMDLEGLASRNNDQEEEIKALKEELAETKERVDELTATVNHLAGIVSNIQYGCRHNY